MKKIVTLLFILTLSSCYVLKPDSNGSTNKDHNNKKEISNPKFVKKNNAIGISYQILSPLVTGAAMYQYVNPVVKYQDGKETKGFQPANAAIGVLGMLAVNKIMNFALGQNKEIPTTDKSIEKWMRKTELLMKNNFITENEGKRLIIIPKTNESNYEVKNITDVSYFKKLFPNVTIENETVLIKKAIPVIEQENLVKLINFYPLNGACIAAKAKYVETARNYDELWIRTKQYPEAKVDLELLASNLVVNGYNLSDFINKYPGSNFLNKVKVNSFKEKYSDYNLKDPTLIQKSVFAIDESIFKQYARNNYTIIENYFNALLNKSNCSTLSKIAFFYSENNWLIKIINSATKLEKAWNIGYNQYSNGDDLVYLLKTFDDYNWNISSNEIETFIDEKFIDEIKRNVSINFNFKQSKTDFDKWRKSNYSSGFIIGSDEVKFLVYGIVKNKSKFSLPVEVHGKSSMKLKNEGLGETARKIYENLVYGGASSGIRDIGEAKDVFNCGYLRPYENLQYALLYNIDGSLQSGIDFGIKGTIMSFQFAQRIIFDNHFVVPVFSKSILTSEMINKQNAALFFINNDLPYSESIDPIRGQKQSVVREELRLEKEQIIEENRRWAEYQMQLKNKGFNNFTITSKTEKIDKIDITLQQESSYYLYFDIGYDKKALTKNKGDVSIIATNSKNEIITSDEDKIIGNNEIESIFKEDPTILSVSYKKGDEWHSATINFHKGGKYRIEFETK